MSTPAVLQPLAAALAALKTSVDANTAGVNQLGTDLAALLAKINAGGTVSAADLQPLLDQVTAMQTAVGASVAAEAASDATVNPPAPTPTPAP